MHIRDPVVHVRVQWITETQKRCTQEKKKKLGSVVLWLLAFPGESSPNFQCIALGQKKIIIKSNLLICHSQCHSDQSFTVSQGVTVTLISHSVSQGVTVILISHTVPHSPSDQSMRVRSKQVRVVTYFMTASRAWPREAGRPLTSLKFIWCEM